MLKFSQRLFLIITMSYLSLAYSQEDGGMPGEFLRWGVGARALSMGRAYTALADDATACYWNPAGLMSSSKFELNGMLVKLYDDTDHNYFAGSCRINRFAALGLGYIGLETNGIQGWDIQKDILTKTREYTFKKYAFLLSGAMRITHWPPLDVGITIKCVHSSITYEENIQPYLGFDLALRYRTSLKSRFWKIFYFPQFIAFNIQNINEGELGESEIPRSLKLGLGYLFTFDNDFRLFASLDYEKIHRRDERLNHLKLGFDVDYKQKCSFRIGIGWPEITLGIGISNFYHFNIDYAGAEHIAEWKQLGYTNKISFNFDNEQMSYKKWYQKALKSWPTNEAKYWLVKIIDSGISNEYRAMALARFGDLEYLKQNYKSSYDYYKEAMLYFDKVKSTEKEDTLKLKLFREDNIRINSYFNYIGSIINLAISKSENTYLNEARDACSDNKKTKYFDDKSGSFETFKLLIIFYQITLSKKYERKELIKEFEKIYTEFKEKKSINVPLAHYYYAKFMKYLGENGIRKYNESLYLETLQNVTRSYSGIPEIGKIKFLGFSDNNFLDDAQYDIGEYYYKKQSYDKVDFHTSLFEFRKLLLLYPETDRASETRNKIKEILKKINQ